MKIIEKQKTVAIFRLPEIPTIRHKKKKTKKQHYLSNDPQNPTGGRKRQTHPTNT